MVDKKIPSRFNRDGFFCFKIGPHQYSITQTPNLYRSFNALSCNLAILKKRIYEKISIIIDCSRVCFCVASTSRCNRSKPLQQCKETTNTAIKRMNSGQVRLEMDLGIFKWTLTFLVLMFRILWFLLKTEHRG